MIESILLLIASQIQSRKFGKENWIEMMACWIAKGSFHSLDIAITTQLPSMSAMGCLGSQHITNAARPINIQNFSRGWGVMKNDWIDVNE